MGVMILKRILIVVGLALPALTSAEMRAEQHVCAECGAEACCRAYCRCVPSTEEKKKLCFDCKCEDFCVPGPSCYLGSKCEAMPLPGKEDACGCGGNCCITWNLWKPRCAEVRTRKVLVVHEVKKEVPTYKWQVEYLCDSCRDCCADAMPLRPQQGAEILPVSAETPIVAPAPAPKTAAKKSWWSNLFSK
jgi:hypothetical protein